MKTEEVEKLLQNDAAQGALLIGLKGERSRYYPAVLGLDRDSGRFVYDYDRLVECFAGLDEMTEAQRNDPEVVDDAMLEATEWVDFNVVRGNPYYGGHAPLLLYKDLDDGKVRDINNPDDESADSKYRKYYEESNE